MSTFEDTNTAPSTPPSSDVPEGSTFSEVELLHREVPTSSPKENLPPSPPSPTTSSSTNTVEHSEFSGGHYDQVELPVQDVETQNEKEGWENSHKKA